MLHGVGVGVGIGVGLGVSVEGGTSDQVVLAGGPSVLNGDVRSRSSRPGRTQYSTQHESCEELGLGAFEADGRQLAQANVAISCWRDGLRRRSRVQAGVPISFIAMLGVFARSLGERHQSSFHALCAAELSALQNQPHVRKVALSRRRFFYPEEQNSAISPRRSDFII